MKYFFADSMDVVDPSYSFDLETRSPHRVRHRDDQYPHEIFARPPYDGILVSKAIVDGKDGLLGKYTAAQRQRFLRAGVREFFRLDARDATRHLLTMGDCGAFTYVKSEYPPYSVDEVIDFYEDAKFDLAVSVDHVILAFTDESDHIPNLDTVPEEWKRRQEITLDLASQFLACHKRRRCGFIPIGVAQGWSPQSYARSVVALQKMGYTRLALGGLVPLKTAEILSILRHVDEVRHKNTQLHLFGVTRCDHLAQFKSYGVTSFDSTSPLRQAFKDDKDNYYTPDRTYVAIRIPQVEGNNTLKQRILAGRVDQQVAKDLERQSLAMASLFDTGKASLEDTLEVLREYELVHDGRKDRTAVYREVLQATPWKQCDCEICKRLGIHVMLFRGAERNRRRGFHNLHVFYQRVQKELQTTFHSQCSRKAGARAKNA